MIVSNVPHLKRIQVLLFIQFLKYSHMHLIFIMKKIKNTKKMVFVKETYFQPIKFFHSVLVCMHDVQFSLRRSTETMKNKILSWFIEHIQLNLL